MIIYDKTIETISTNKLIGMSREMIANIADMFLVSAAEVSVDMLCDDNHAEYPTKADMDVYLKCLSSIAGDMARDFCHDFQTALLEYLSKVKVNPIITRLAYDKQGCLTDITVSLEMNAPS